MQSSSVMAPLNMNFSQRVVVTPDGYHWMPSPSHSVERMPLERVSAETGHTTSIVRYAPQAAFPEHIHAGGEEIFVMMAYFKMNTGTIRPGPTSEIQVVHDTPRAVRRGACCS